MTVLLLALPPLWLIATTALILAGRGMDIGTGVALGALIVSAGQIFAEAMRHRRNERIADLEAELKRQEHRMRDLTAALSSALRSR